MFSLQRQTFSIKISFTVFHIYIPSLAGDPITDCFSSNYEAGNFATVDDKFIADGKTRVDRRHSTWMRRNDSGITVISDDLCVDKIRDGGHWCRPVESSRWHWSEGFNRGPRLVRSPRTSWLSNLGHGARYAFILDSYAFHTGRFTSSVVPLFFFLFFLLLFPIKSCPDDRCHESLNFRFVLREKYIF